MRRNHPRQCPAAGDDFYAYGTTSRPDENGRLPCPRCTKPVKLIRREVPRRHIIPAHLAPAQNLGALAALASSGSAGVAPKIEEDQSES